MRKGKSKKRAKEKWMNKKGRREGSAPAPRGVFHERIFGMTRTGSLRVTQHRECTKINSKHSTPPAARWSGLNHSSIHHRTHDESNIGPFTPFSNTIIRWLSDASKWLANTQCQHSVYFIYMLQSSVIILVNRNKKPSYRWGTARRGRASWNLVKFCTNVDDLYLKSSETRLLPIRL